MTTLGPRVLTGEVVVYRLFDVAEAVDLAAAERAAAAASATGPSARLRLEGAQSASAVELPRPPVEVALGVRDVPLESGVRRCEATAAVYDYGVVSIRYRLPIAPGTPVGALVPLAEELFVHPTPALDAAARKEAEELSRLLAPALEEAHAWEGLESYQVFLVRALEGGPWTADAVLAQAPVAELLLGETSAKPLSEAERADVLSNRHSYLVDDLAVVHWNSAFVWEPSGVGDIPDLLELATAQLLELRYYDALLDRELHAIYDELERKVAPLVAIFTRRYRMLQRRTAALLLDISEMIERLENAVKIVGDFYLARVYQAAVRRFRLDRWQEAVLRKQKLLADVNELIGDAADTNRSELLEIVVILLIAFEILAAFRGH
ncbi:MAG: hypothetical protein U0229_22950 [Anaeromyxobacter sp.]